MKVVKIILKRSDGCLLALQKTERKDFMSEKWELPGGKVQNEELEEAATREILDETGLKVAEITRLVDIVIREKIKIDCSIFYATIKAPKVELSGEHQNYKWVDSEEYRELELHRDAAYSIPIVENLDYYMRVGQ